MRLEYTCSVCKRQNSFKPTYATRGLLQMKVGDEVNVHCEICGKQDKKHINRIHAVVNNRKVVLGLCIGIALVIGGFSFFREWGLVFLAIPFTVWYQEMMQTRDFNSYKIRRR